MMKRSKWWDIHTTKITLQKFCPQDVSSHYRRLGPSHFTMARKFYPFATITLKIGVMEMLEVSQDILSDENNTTKMLRA